MFAIKICPKCYNYHKDEFDICRICGNDLTEYTEEYYNKKPKKIKTLKEKKKLKFPLPYFMQFWEKSTYIKVGVTISAFVVAISLTVFLWDYEPKVKTDGNFIIAESNPRETVKYNLNSSVSGNNKVSSTEKSPTNNESASTTTTVYEWKLNTSSDGYDWYNADDVEKDVWCSNSFASWRLMGYDIPSSASQSILKSYLDEFYKDTSNRSVDLVTATEVYAELKGIY